MRFQAITDFLYELYGLASVLGFIVLLFVLIDMEISARGK